MKTKNTIIISCVLVVGIILSGLAFAGSQGKGDHKGFGSKQSHNGHSLEKKVFYRFHLAIANEVELGLSEEQYEKIKTLKINTKKDLIIKRAEIDVLKIDIKAKLWEDTIDKKGINKLIDKKYELKKEKAKALVDAYAQFKNIITEEQKKALKTIVRQRHKK